MAYDVTWLDLGHVEEERISADVLLLVFVVVGRGTLDVGTNHVAHRIVDELLAGSVADRCGGGDYDLGKCGQVLVLGCEQYSIVVVAWSVLMMIMMMMLGLGSG